MKKKYFILAIGCSLLSLTTLAQSVYKDYTDGEIYVKFKTGTLKLLKAANPQAIAPTLLPAFESSFAKVGVTKIEKPFYQANDDVTLQHILKIKFTDFSKVDAFIETLKLNASVEYAEKVPLTRTTLTPNDPQLGSQWHLTKINATNAWNVFSGNSNITVAVIDNAVDITHPDLSPNLWVNPGEIAGNNIDDDNNGYIDDINGWDAADNDNNPNPPTNGMSHGTHCAGIVGARTNNGVGIAAIGFNVKLIGVKCQLNSGSNTGIANGYGGIIYAAKVRARVISCSWGGSGSSAAEQSVINYAWNRGCIVIAAAGNSGVSTVFYPAGYSNVYAVASTGTTDVKSGFSNYGSWIDISAPGENILSTLPSNTYGNQSGTSMATPLVAGLAGLMLSKNPLMTQAAVLNCISSTAVNIYSVNTATLAGSLGAGRIDAFAAMNCANATLGNAPVANFYTLTRNVCPGFAVQFLDSTLYAFNPTTYTWNFQGGTPAVSNATNPSVTWASPGTYSVSLTASNANGSNAISKTGYITVVSPGSLPLNEGFQGGTILPPNWTALNIDQDNIFWTLRNGVGGFGTSSACAMFDNYNLDAANTRDELRTPRYNFSAVAQASLSFDVAYSQYNASFSDTLELRLSTNCGASWTSIYLKGGTTLGTAPNNSVSLFTPTAAQWRKEGINLNTYAGQSSVMIALVNRGHYGQPIYVDNINISFTAAATPSANFNAPAAVCASTTVNYTNTSTTATTYNWTFQGGLPSTSTATNPSVVYNVPGVYSTTLIASSISGSNTVVKTITVAALPSLTVTTIPSGICAGQAATIGVTGSTAYTLSPSNLTTPPFVVNPSATTNYSITAANAGCSSTITQTTTVNVTPLPVVSVNSTSICLGFSTTLTASGATTYSWSNGAVINPITVTPTLSTVYTVTGTTNGCSGVAVGSVSVLPTVNLTVTALPNPICVGNTAVISVIGANSYSLNPGGLVGSGSSLTPVTFTVMPSVTSTYSILGNNGACSGNAPITITVNPLPLFAAVTKTNASCFGSCNGIINASATGLGAPFTYSVNGVSATMPSANLCAGIYSVTLRSVGGCISNTNVTIAQPPVLLASSSTTATACSGVCVGAFSITASGGTPTYFYTSSNGCLTPNCTNLCANVYTTVVSDANSCTVAVISTVSINPSGNLTVTATHTNASCGSCPNGSLSSTVIGGSAPYTYSWQPIAATTPSVANVLPGCYTLTVTDVNGCVKTASTCVAFAFGLTPLSSIGNLQLYPNPAQHQFVVKNTASKRYELTLYDSQGKLVYTLQSQEVLTEIPVDTFNRGIYLVKLNSEGEQAILKLVLN